MTHRPWLFGILGGSVLSLAHLALFGQVELSPTANLVKLEWTLTAMVGACYSSWFLLDSIGDRRWLRRTGRNGSNQDAAEILVLLAAVLVGVHLLFWVLGVLGLLSVNGPHTLSNLLIGATFTWWGQLLVVLLVRVQLIRRRLRGSRT